MTVEPPAAGPCATHRQGHALGTVLVVLVLSMACLAGCGGSGTSTWTLPGFATPPSRAAVAQARRWSADLVAAIDTVPRTSVFALKDNLSQPMACLRLIALQPGSYLGVYQVGTGNDFVVDLAASHNLRNWREVRTLELNASQPDLVTAGRGFLLAAEATTRASGLGVHNIEVRYYPSVSSLVLGRPSRRLILPHRLAEPGSGIEGTPVVEAADLNGSLDHSTITISFHYLAPGLVDREGIGVLTDFSTWSAGEDEHLDEALVHAGVDGKHGDRSFVPDTGGALEVVEAQRDPGSPWEVYLYDRVSDTVAALRIKTPGASRSFANPAITCVPDPAGTDVAVVTLFLPNQQAGPGEAGELLYYRPSPLCAR